MAERITYAQLSEILFDLGFVQHTVPDSHCDFRHAGTNTIILLAPHLPEDSVTPLDVKYVRRVLDEKGLLEAKDFDRRIAESLASRSA
jgi:hypothetical protein